VPHWVSDAVVASLIPIGVGLMATMYRVGNTMGKIDQRLNDHEKDIRDLQASWASSQTGYRQREN